jgi:SSS family transporter
VRWWAIGLSIMATQASAVTFLSTPGQAYEDGLGFVQFYFGLPIAVVLLSAIALPIYHKLNVYTAYQYLDRRFDRKTRQLTAFLFLLQRGLGAGLSIYAPAIVLSSVLGWSLGRTNAIMGALVILYTVSGGARAVSRTQTLQMVVMLGGMALGLHFIVSQLPPSVSLADAVAIAGHLGKTRAVDWSLRLDTRYTVWAGLTGGLFLQLAYFGTDQSQVQRYLTGGSLAESRLGLLFNGLVKIPMQFFILFVGLMVLVFYQFHAPPLFFHEAGWQRARAAAPAEAAQLEAAQASAFAQKQRSLDAILAARHAGHADGAGGDEELKSRAGLRAADADMARLRGEARALVKKVDPRAETKDADYIFIGFVTSRFPAGLVGLLLAVIFCAAMSATAAALSALGSTTVVDFYRASVVTDASDAHYLAAARVFTVLWGLLAMLFATFASLLDNLIQAVNILGSLFYGTMLGVFVVGFFFARVGGTAVFIGALCAEAAVIAVFAFTPIGYLWYNPIGCAIVVLVALLVEKLRPGAARG